MRIRIAPRRPNRLRKFVLPISVAASLTCAANLCVGDALPEGPGRAATIRVCGKCHSPERAASLHQRRSAWEDTIVKMMKLGAQGSDEELEAVLGYLSTHFGTEVPGPLDINKARAVDLEAGLLLKRSEAKTIIAYRDENGPFKSIDDLRKVPGIDFQKIEAKKSRLVF
ncbi:MAG TPA: helix-hairpin-helix domain-containing protein [Bryobacteraceae bacterium]|nr:helix-hairpin-helix domain-containing protein [Bryobacteraceae bacterium]